MRDRSVEFPNRYRMIPVPGSANIVDLEPVPGEVNDEGTPINKATLLQDETAALYGLDGTAVPDDCFNAIIDLLVDPSKSIVNMKVVDKSGAPVANAYLTGVKNIFGGEAVTGINGNVYVTASVGTQTTVSIKAADDVSGSTSFTIPSGSHGLFSKTLTISYNESTITYSESKTVKISNLCKSIDVVAVGGGGGGGGVGQATGGGGGYVTKTTVSSFTPYTDLQVTVGAGGTAGTSTGRTENNYGGSGGTSSFLTVSASGGGGGHAGSPSTGNGSGGTASGSSSSRGGNGGAGSGGYGGGGGGRGYVDEEGNGSTGGGYGGSPYGGNGASGSSSYWGDDGSGPGGGGGGGYRGGTGYRGLVTLTFHH